MAKTNEEITKVLEKNYKAVQVAELHVYDKNVKLNKQYKKEVKELDSKLKKDLKLITQEIGNLSGGFRKQEVDITKVESNLQGKLDKKIEVIKSTYETTIIEIAKLAEAEVARLNDAIIVIKKEHTLLVTNVTKEYNKSEEASQKVLVDINVKGEKDERIFASKIEDLKTKHELKVEELKSKETIKMQKLTEASNKQTLKLQDTIESIKEKHIKKLSQLELVYEEELAEIDENIDLKNDEFAIKLESTRTSADQRIAVREKHLQRSIDDHDQRSAKQHRKDIEKFRKEAERDLALLTKTHTSDKELSVIYRKNFIIENLEKLSKIEKENANTLELKQKDAKFVSITLAFDVKNTTFEYEKLLAEALVSYHKAYTEVINKKEEVLKQKELDLSQEADNQKKLLITFDTMNLVHADTQRESLEQVEKDLHVESINKTKSEVEAKDILDTELVTLTKEKQLTKFELNKDLELILKQEIIEGRNLEHKKLATNKEEFLAYQSLLEPLYNERVNEIFAYEEQEIMNRYQLKITFLEKQIDTLSKHYNIVIEKFNNVLVVERAPFDEMINSIAGTQKSQLESFQNEHEEKVTTLKDKIAPLTERRDRKTRKLYEDELHQLIIEFSKSQQRKEKQIQQLVGMYEQALTAAIARNVKALSEAEYFYNSEDLCLKDSIALLKKNKTSELEDAKLRFDRSEENLHDFATKSASRNTSNTEDNLSYYDQKVLKVQTDVKQIESDFEQLRDATNLKSSELLDDYLNQKSIVISSLQVDQNREEINFEALKKEIAASKTKHNNEAESNTREETNSTNNNAGIIKKKHTAIIQVNNDNLCKLTNEYNSRLSEIGKKVATSSDNLEEEKKVLQKNFDASTKIVLAAISKKLTEDIAAL